MRYLLIFPIFIGFAACQSTVPFEPVSDPCKSLQYLSVVGTKEADIGASTFPEGTRIIRPGMAVTQDYRAERVNVHIGTSGRVERIDCG